MVVITTMVAPQTILGEILAKTSLISTVETSIVLSASFRGLQTQRWQTHGITGMPLADARRRVDKIIQMVETVAHHLPQADSSLLSL